MGYLQTNPTQTDLYYAAVRKQSERDQAFFEMLTHPTNPLTRQDLGMLIKRRPEVYSRYAGFLENDDVWSKI